MRSGGCCGNRRLRRVLEEASGGSEVLQGCTTGTNHPGQASSHRASPKVRVGLFGCWPAGFWWTQKGGCRLERILCLFHLVVGQSQCVCSWAVLLGRTGGEGKAVTEPFPPPASAAAAASGGGFLFESNLF